MCGNDNHLLLAVQSMFAKRGPVVEAVRYLASAYAEFPSVRRTRNGVNPAVAGEARHD